MRVIYFLKKTYALKCLHGTEREYATRAFVALWSHCAPDRPAESPLVLFRVIETYLPVYENKQYTYQKS